MRLRSCATQRYLGQRASASALAHKGQETKRVERLLRLLVVERFRIFDLAATLVIH